MRITDKSLLVNPHVAPPTSIDSLGRSLWTNRQLIALLIRREVTGRYRGSAIGIAWSLLNPLFMLAVYTFVFSVVFKARWITDGEETKGQFGLLLFVGIIVHGLFADVLVRAPSLIRSNANYVKKVVFPLEVLPVVCLGSAIFHSLTSFAILIAASMAINASLHWTAVFVPLVILPLIIFILGLVWTLAAVGVFLRDLEHSIGIFTTVVMFLSPVFYPVSALPEKIRCWILANPLSFIIEQTREVLIWGQLPNWSGLALYTAVAVVIAWAGYLVFQTTRRGFADVL